MKRSIPLLFAAFGATSLALAQSTPPVPASTPAATPAPALASATTSQRTDLYHVHMAKSATGKASEHGKALQQQAPDAPMKGHYIVLRHQSGDSWDYCAIEHLGTKATVDAARPAAPASQAGLNEWHNDTFATGPSWAEFSKQLGIDEASKSTGAGYLVAIYRPVAGQRDALDKFLMQPPDRAVDTYAGTVVLQHAEGAAWSFIAVSRYTSWADYAKEQTNSIAQMNKADAGWFQLRNLVSFHTDTLCDRIAP